jgi:hypothetical protein
MPIEAERSARKAAKKLKLKGKALLRYVYGTLRKTGWKPKGEK